MKTITTTIVLAASLLLPLALARGDEPAAISGRYPHLTMWNKQGECGVGAVVPFADRLWVVTYAPHMPNGSDDKLYEIDGDLKMTIRPESIGGTPANRMIHRESNQLFIGPYVIDAERNVRVIPYAKMPGRPTANARHLSDPANKIYMFTMEEGLYEIDVKSLDVTTIMKDGHAKDWVDPLPGYHGKGAYSAQGRLVVANNGEKKLDWKNHPYGPSGVLAESTALTPGDAKWSIVERAQFVDVSGPGGIEGNADPNEPLWAIGWDHRSVILKVLDGGEWTTYRLPVSDFSYIASHGWYTEWPRIRSAVPGSRQTERMLMNIHGGWFAMPGEFGAKKPRGLTPIGNYLKITGDFAEWNGRLVFGCDDAAITGGNPMAGQSHSNLWFTTWDALRECGRAAGWGGPWVRDDVKANTPSDPYLIAEYYPRVLHLSHESDEPVWFTIEHGSGDGEWTALANIEVPARGYVYHLFETTFDDQWVRLRTNRDAKSATAYFHYGTSAGAATDRAMFDSLADVEADGQQATGIIRPRGEDKRTMQMLTADGAYYEMGDDLKLVRVSNADGPISHMNKIAAINEPKVTIDAASVIVTDRRGRWRLPVSSEAYRTDASLVPGKARAIREVVTERTLLNAGGTFYVNPDDDSLGFRGLKPIATHNKRIGDFCSWRGLLVMTGVKADAKADGHTLVSDDAKAAVWVGDIDDLWKLGKPRGVGGPWNDAAVKADEPSDAYLMTGFDRKKLALSHDAEEAVAFVIEVDTDNSGTWRRYAELSAAAGKPTVHEFPAGYAAHWVRVIAKRACTATATFTYE